MKSQWACLLQNLGEWQGSFTQFSPQGDFIADTPTLVSLEGINDNQTIRQLVRRFLPNPDQPAEPNVQDLVLEYSSLGRNILFFENGAFSQGSMQLGPFSEFGAELGLIDGDRRLRLVQLFNQQSQLHQLTLIRERRAGTEAIERPPLQVKDLIGTWQGEGVSLYPDWRSPDTFPTTLQLHLDQPDQLVQQLSFGVGDALQVVTSVARVAGSILHFDSNSQPVQVLLLPDGASATSPLQIQLGQPFFLEVGWLLQPNLRQRLIRRYDSKGSWVSLTWITERKVAL